MKVLVTGGTGFTGKALVRRMLDEGHQVVAMDYKEGHKTAEIRDWGAELVIGSVTDVDVVRRCMQGVEVVHHVAAAFRELTRRTATTMPSTSAARRTCWKPRARPGCASSSIAAPAACTATSTTPRRRELAHPAARLLPADQVRGRAHRARVR
jgi:hypothetical protein